MVKSWLIQIGVVLLAVVVGGSAVWLLHPATNTGEMQVDSSKAKQLWTCGMHPQVLQDHPGSCPICRMKLVPLKNDSASDSTSESMAPRKILYYWDPMLGPSSIAHAPGKSAMGMDLVPVYADDPAAGPTVKIDPTIVQNMGVRTAIARRGPLRVSIRAVGTVEVPEAAIDEVNLKVSGWIEKIYADTEGMHITTGQVLFDLYSPDIEIAEQELIGANKAMKNLNPQSSEIVRHESQAMIDSARQKLSQWGVADADIDAIKDNAALPRSVPIRSRSDGDLVEKMIVRGSSVTAGAKLMRIESHSSLWLNAQVYEDQISLISIGQQMEATFESVPGRTYTAAVTFVHPHVDHMTRTVIVRAAMNNTGHQLHPGMYATVNIYTQPVADAVLVPREAVIDTGTRQIIFVSESEGHFSPRNVTMGVSGDDDQVQILQGIAPGETVVTSGQFLMDVESRTIEAIDKLRRSDAPGAELPPVPATQAATPALELKVIHCSMKNADWVQAGTTISNPYLGQSMPTCGNLTRTIAAPDSGSALDSVLQAYLPVLTSLENDNFDAKQVAFLKGAADRLPVESDESLQNAVNTLNAADSLPAARNAFAKVSDALIHLLQPVAK